MALGWLSAAQAGMDILPGTIADFHLTASHTHLLVTAGPRRMQRTLSRSFRLPVQINV